MSGTDFQPPSRSVANQLRFHINGEPVVLEGHDPRQMLLEYLRDSKGLTGTKRSCLQGGCGACAVAVQDWDAASKSWKYHSVNSCLKPLSSCNGASITTVEGVGVERKGCHQVQKRIAENHGMQCGFCTPGMVMNTYAMLKAGGKPTAMESMESYDGNICRCTGYRGLVVASESFAKDPSKPAQELAAKCGDFDADKEICKEAEHCGMRPVTEPVTFTANGFTWNAPTNLADVMFIKAKSPRAQYVLGDTAKGIRSAAYEVMNGKAMDVISLKNVAELNVLQKSGSSFVFGSGLTIQHMVDALTADGSQKALGVVEALKHIAQHHIRNEAGWAGNLVITHMRGFPSDLVPALMAADASVSYVSGSPSDEKTVSLADFKVGGGGMPLAGLLTKLQVDTANNNGFFKYYRVGARKWLAQHFVGAGFNIVVDKVTMKITDARVAIGFYAGSPKRCMQAEAALVGGSLDTATLQKAIAAFHAEMDAEFVEVSQFVTLDNPKGKDEYRKSLPDTFFFKFFQEAQVFYGVKAWKAAEIGSIPVYPLASGELKYQERPGLDNRPQINALSLTTGSTRYSDDIPNPALFGYPVLSECATGTIEAIDSKAAEEMEGVVAIVTAADIPGANSCGFVPSEEQVFVPVGGEIMTTGQQIALVVGTSYRAAKRGANAVIVKVKDANKGAVISLDQAIAAESFLGGAHFKDAINKGDVEAGLKSSDVVIEASTYVGGQHAFPMEKQTCLAVPEERNGMTLWHSTQAPDFTRAVVAGVLKIPGSFLVCKQQRAGGAFGPKNARQVPVAAMTAVACHKLEKSVKVAFEASLEQAAVGGRHNFKVKFRVGANKDGKIQSCDVEAWCNGGCTHDFTGFLNLEMGESISGVYNWPNFRVNVHAMKTNTPSNTAVRSFGNPQGFFICETILEHVAAKVGKPVEEIREINMCKKDNAVTPWGQPMEYYNVDSLWAKIMQDSKFEARQAAIETFNREHRWRKRGISAVPLTYGHAYIYAAGSGALVNICGSDGSVTVHHGGCEIGQGIHTKVAQVVAISLGCPLEFVRIADTNTEVVPNMRFTGGSITSEVVCEAARKACKELNATMAPHREFLKKKEGKEPEWAAVVAAANTVLGHQEKLSATGIFAPTTNCHTTDVEGNPNGSKFHGDYFTYGAGVSEVELDVLTGEVRTLRSDILFDVGQSLNPGIDIGQIEGAFMFGIGFYMQEEVLRDDRGVERSQGVWAYKPPMASDVPVEFTCELVRDNPFPKGVLGSKAVGEPPFMLSYTVLGAAKKAIASARKDAGADPFVELPMPCTADAIQRACAVDSKQFAC